MNQENIRPWFSWALTMPKRAILALALTYARNYLAGWRFDDAAASLSLTALTKLGEPLTEGPPIARFLRGLALVQLNIEVIYMILTMKSNHWEKEKAVAKATDKATPPPAPGTKPGKRTRRTRAAALPQGQPERQLATPAPDRRRPIPGPCRPGNPEAQASRIRYNQPGNSGNRSVAH